ncbi:MurR/RpiR family transcriptional regulator [Clostridium sp. BJN0001]|uniref:MurR/RpiR family transcriptional regulator n=1 Tax=Clostridium sp. BJN0001 TaxID=2930219 RepID=UPI001FD431D1|nr:MurR/RpiR family transcriptional regulator [Clostridium sp. BJN0001]
MSDVYRKIAEKIPKMSKAQEKIAKYILLNQTKTPFLTVENLAKYSGVSIATVTRFVIFIGYNGYPEFLKETQKTLQQHVVDTEKMNKENRDDDSRDDNVFDIFKNDINDINSTMKNVNLIEVENALEILEKCERLFIIANGNIRSLGMMLKNSMEFMFKNVTIIDNIDQIGRMINVPSANDVAISISVDKCHKETVQIFTYLKKKGINTISITDSMLSPLVPYADANLIAHMRRNTKTESFVAPLSLINVIISLLEKRKGDDYKRRIEKLNETYEEFNLIV